MPTIRFSRPFASGSRPTPDPFDKFLDSHGFYRKHTPRDSTNLFRVVSEQLYDTQEHHMQVRKDCVNFLIKHRDQYEALLQDDFDQYVKKMAKAETFGTLTELRAMGYLFKRNIILYGPFDLGSSFVEEPEYKDPVLRVFHATHFDSVFEKSYIMDAAFCQSVVYEMLYKNVFKLPDIEYSVETMLHSDIIHEPSKHEYGNGDEYATHIVFDDGRQFELDRPEHTLCILSNPDRCHFHNKDFDEIVKRDSRRFERSILSDKFNSCVRQLLFDGITPFPYKVAKALDENIYRNVEFDSWNEERKASKHRQNYKVGVECLVKLSETKDDFVKARIQAKESDDSYVVFIDKFAEKRSVHSASLRPLHGAQRDPIISRRIGQCMTECLDQLGLNLRNVKPRTKLQSIHDSNFDCDAICNSFDFQQYISLSNFNFSPNHRQELIAYPAYTQSSNMNTNNSTISGNTSSKPNKIRNQNAQNHANAQNDTNDKQQSVQLKVDGENSYGKTGHEAKSDVQQTPTPTTVYYQHQSQDQNIDGAVPMSQQHVQNYYHQGPAPIYYCPTPEYSNEQGLYSSDMVMQPGVYAIPAPYQAPPQPNMYAPISGNQASHYPVPVGSWPAYAPPLNPPGYVLSGAPHYAVPAVPAPMPFSWPFLSRELLRSNGRINFNSNYAFAPTGEDLPLNDKISVRFYYNLGIEYFKLLQQVHGYGAVMAMIDGDNVANNYDQPPPGEAEGQQHQMVSEFQQFNIETNEGDTQSPSKPRIYNESGYRRNPNLKYKRNENRSTTSKHFQGTFNGPTNTFKKNNQKYHQGGNSGNSSYDGTPMKENGGKLHQYGHGMSKREQSNADVENGNGNGNIGFGSNVPPFPYFDPNEQQHYGPPGNAYPRMTPPGTIRPASVPNAPYHGHGNHQMHGFPGSYWLPNPPPGSLQPQSQSQSQLQSQLQSQSQQQSQPHSLNTSGASNPSQ